MTIYDLLAFGVIMGVIFYLFKGKTDRNVTILDKDAEVRAKWKAEQERTEAEIAKRVQEFREKKAKYQKIREEQRNANEKGTNNDSNLHTTNNPADVLVIQRNSERKDD